MDRQTPVKTLPSLSVVKNENYKKKSSTSYIDSTEYKSEKLNFVNRSDLAYIN